MAEKGQTSSITSVTEEEMSAGSESDTTESSYSNITSSVLSSTDTDDKLTPGLISISISNINGKADKTSKRRRIHQVEDEKPHDNEFENTVHKQGSSETGITNHGENVSQNGFQVGIPMPGIKFPYGSNPLPLKYARGNGETKWKGGNLNHPGFHHQTSSFVKPKLETLNVNGNVDDKYSTDFSETSSVQISNDRNNNNELDEEDTDGVIEGTCSESQKQAFLPDFFSSTWYQAPCFNRYWSHYRFVMEWYHLHVQAVKNLQVQMFSGWGYPQQWKYTQQPQQAKRGKTRKSRHSRRTRQKRRKRSESSSFSAKSQNRVLQAGPGHNSSLQPKTVINKGSDDEELEMEITDDMLEFFTTSYKHKIERDKDEQDPISSAPTERPGVRRTEEMKELYGIGAPMIQGMETAMQMTFDRFLDRFQPSPWPNMPLKINFS